MHNMCSPQATYGMTQSVMPVVIMVIQYLADQKSYPGKVKSLPAHDIDSCITNNGVE